MRITNSMTTNRLLMNLNRNANNVDRLFMQLSSGKVIQRPSDNPIIASRALRFRTNVAEVQQHQRNVAQAQSWMEVSEQNLQNTTEILTRTRSELMVQGASGTYTFQNRQSIVRVAELLFQQMKTELNGTFAGRYVFSGFRTNQPPIVTQNNISTAPGITPANDVNFEITKNITRQNIQDAGAVFWRNANPIVASPPDPPIPPADVAVGGTVDAAWFDPPLAAGDPSPFNMEYEYPSGSGNFYTVNAGDPLSADAISALGAGDMTTLQAIPEGGIHAGTPDVPAGTLHAVVTYEWLNRPDRQTANWEDDPNIILTVVGQPSTPGGPGYPHGINILRLPYHAHYDANGNQVRDIQVPPFLAGLPVNVVSVNNAPNPYIPVAGSITFIRETGEFVIHSNDLPAFDTSHFTTPTNATRTLDFSNATFPIPAGTYINVAGTDVYIGGSTILSTIADAINAAGIAEIANIGTPLPPGQTHLALFSVVTGSAGNFSVTGLGPIGATQVLYPTGRDVTLAPYRGVTLTYNINGVFQNELNPIIFFDTNRADNGNVLFFSQANQELQFEMGTNTHLTINAQARDVAPWQMFADMNSLIRWVNNIYNNPDFDTNSEEAARERAFFSEQLYTKFTNTMERFDGHIQTTTTEFTALGSRMERMEMVSVRLDENEDTFRALRDQNENIDYIEILMRLNSAEAVFQAAMQIGARVNQLSLVNFI